MRRVVVFAGGKGTRLAPLTLVFPKPLMPLGDTPILEIVIRQLKRGGLRRVTLAVGHLAQLIEAYFGDGSRLGVEIEYVREEVALGTAGPLASIDGLRECFLAMNGDVLSTLDYAEFIRNHECSGAALSIAAHRRTQQVDFGVIVANDGLVTDYIEKPSSDYLVSMGVYAISPHVLGYIEPNVALDLPELVKRLLRAGETVRSVPFEGYWLDIGRHEDFELAQTEFRTRRFELLGEDG